MRRFATMLVPLCCSLAALPALGGSGSASGVRIDAPRKEWRGKIKASPVKSEAQKLAVSLDAAQPLTLEAFTVALEPYVRRQSRRASAQASRGRFRSSGEKPCSRHRNAPLLIRGQLLYPLHPRGATVQRPTISARFPSRSANSTPIVRHLPCYVKCYCHHGILPPLHGGVQPFRAPFSNKRPRVC